MLNVEMKNVKNNIPITRTLRGPVTVTYREEGSEWFARALEFDLVGVGKSREAAFQELQEIFSDYAEEILQSKGKVHFFNPSSSDEWENTDKEYYQIVFVLKSAPTKLAPVFSSIQDMRRLRNAVSGIQLQPNCCM